MKKQFFMKYFLIGAIVSEQKLPGAIVEAGSNSSTSTNSPNKQIVKIAIVGGGAGGLELAVRLGKRLGKRKKRRLH